MSGWSTPAAYVPDRAPTWPEVILAVLIAGMVNPRFLWVSTPSWPAVLAGFVAAAIAVGPGANSSIGRRVGQWFRGIGIAGRATVIVLFAIGVWVAFQWPPVPRAAISDASYGGLLAILLFVVVQVVATGDVAGWRPERG